jgi:two-component system cell cycle response regulator
MININNQATKLNSAPPVGRRDLRIAEVAAPIYLVLMSGGLPGRMIRLGSGETLVGRADDNAVPIFDVDVSRYHAMFRARETGEVWLEDLGSTNGTFRNGERLADRVAVRINDGDQVQFGSSVVFKFLRPSPSDERLLGVLFERAACDPLTGLYNRAYFLDQIVYQAMRGARAGHGLAVLLLDIDHFKRINDTHGHGVGDEVLRMVARVLRDAIRGTDMVARYGGEEFILAATVPAAGQARAVAEQVRAALAARPILAAGLPVPVTASLGGTFAEPGRFREPAEMILTADRALYRAKRAGRDRVFFEEDPSRDPP